MRLIPKLDLRVGHLSSHDLPGSFPAYLTCVYSLQGGSSWGALLAKIIIIDAYAWNFIRACSGL